MLALIFILPLVVALLCLALDRRTPTRWLGVGAAGTLLVCAGALLAARLLNRLPLALIDRTWMALDQRSYPLALAFDAANWLFALLALVGGGLSLLALALAVPSNVRGFGGLFTAALLALAAVVAGLANQAATLLPFMWALVALLAFLTLRASRALGGSDAPLLVLLAGLAGALIALGAVLLRAAAPESAVPMQALLVAWILAGLLALGAPPFHAPVQALAEAPAALTGALLGAGLPLLGGCTLIRFVTDQGAGMPQGWRFALTLLGVLTLLTCAAGALGTTRLRQIIAWHYSAQIGLLMIALGQGGGTLTDRAAAPLVAAPALLANTTLATVACYLAVAVLERRAGTDDLAEIELRAPLALPGLVFLIGAASAAGLPGTWGWWARLWLFDELLRSAAWAVPIVLAGSALLALAFLAPLALFLRRPAAPHAAATRARGRPTATMIVGAAGAAPLLILGVAPWLAWRGWLADFAASVAPGAPAMAVSLPDTPTQIVCGLAALLLIVLPFVAHSSRCAPLPEAQPRQPGVVAPRALAESLRGLAWVAAPTEAFETAWRALQRVSRGLRRGLALFEQRYYLAGLLIAVILIIMLFIQ